MDAYGDQLKGLSVCISISLVSVLGGTLFEPPVWRYARNNTVSLSYVKEQNYLDLVW